MVPAAAPPQPQWFSPASPGDTPWAERGPRCETTWIPPRQGWAGEPVGRARTRALIGRRRSKHPERWGGAGSGRRRRRLRRFRRFLELESEAQVPWAWWRSPEGTRGWAWRALGPPPPPRRGPPPLRATRRLRSRGLGSCWRSSPGLSTGPRTAAGLAALRWAPEVQRPGTGPRPELLREDYSQGWEECGKGSPWGGIEEEPIQDVDSESKGPA